MKTAIIYCRVSSKKQEKEGESLENQEKACRDFCKNNNMQVFGVYKEAFTGKSTSRPVFDISIQNAIINQVNYFVIFDIDRFSREGYGVYSQIKNQLLENNIELRDSKNIIQNSNYIFNDDTVDMKQYKWNKNNSSKYAEVILSTHAEEEGLKILQRTIPREIQLEKQGYQVRQSNFGYKNKRIEGISGKKTIQVPDEIESERIIEMFETKANGILSDKEIVNILNIKGYKSRNGKKLTTKQMITYISYTVYAGVIQRKWTGGKAQITPYKGLVSIDLWNKANKGKKIIYKNKNDLLIENNPTRIIKKNMTKDEFIFRGKLRYQDKAMRFYIKKGNVYYREGSGISPAFNISQKKLLEIIENELPKFQLPEYLKEKISNGTIDFLKNEKSGNQNNEKLINKEIEKIKSENNGIARKNLNGKISDELMQEIIKENEEKIKDLNKQFLEIQNKKKIIDSKVVELLKFLTNTEKLWNESDDQKKKILINLIIDELYFDNKKELVVTTTKLFELIKTLNNSRWHPH